MFRRASGSERIDDDHASATARAWEREDTQLVRGAIGFGRRLGYGAGQHIADAGDVVGVSIGIGTPDGRAKRDPPLG
ncbi:MAG: hypothetical protein GY788_04965 [bacterium]|nr:hypothetical protein [bacterium]